MNKVIALPLILAGLIGMSCPSSADVIPLYTGSGMQTPSDQNWLYFSNGDATQSAVEGVTTLSTMAGHAIQAGYSRWPLSPVLNRTDGYTVTFAVRLNAEDHSSGNRAGFSVIVLSDGDSTGIELGFWADRIWAQDSGFAQAEMVMHDTTHEMADYALTVQGESYYLHVDGRQILTGPLRYYGGTVAYPYSLTNFLFMGDDTSSARAQVAITHVALRTGKDSIREDIAPRPAASWRYKIWLGM